MFAFLLNSLLAVAEPVAKEGGFMKFYEQYLNIPGFEAWKFLNLAIFISLMVYVLRKPLGEAFRAKRDQIRADLIRAEEEKKAAMARLTTAEGKLAQLETEKENILREAKDEAAAEKKRLADQTKTAAERLRQQADADLLRLLGQTRAELRRFSAQESIRLAEEKLRAKIDAKADAKLVEASISEIGGLN